MAAAGEKSFAFYFPSPSFSHPPPRHLKTHLRIPPSAAFFPSKKILSISTQEPRRRRFIFARSSLEPVEEKGEFSEDSISSPEDRDYGARSPRRNLLVQFTCNSCGERTERVINRVAFDRGTVFLQCGGCAVYHKLIDNLNLVVEYDLRDEQ